MRAQPEVIRAGKNEVRTDNAESPRHAEIQHDEEKNHETSRAPSTEVPAEPEQIVKVRQEAAPLFGARGLLIAIGAAIVVCWPVFFSGGIIVFEDTSSYFQGGKKIWTVLIDTVLSAAETATANGKSARSAAVDALAVDAGGGSTVGRSFIYSLFSYLMLSVAGAVGIAMTQATLVVFTFFALIDKRALAAPWVLVAGGLGVATLTTLPWHAVYLMPDVFGSIIIVFGAVLVTHFSDMSGPKKVLLTALAALATATHYGNIPVMAGVGGFALLWLLLSRRITLAAILAVLFAIGFSPAANIAGSSLFLKTTSAAPMRLPILLARSLDDGPANWYLTRECGSSDFAMCEAFGDDIPESISELLWAEDGVESLSAEVLQRIRDEEMELLVQVFLAYPVAQTTSLLGNTLKQLTRFGTGQINFAQGVTDELKIRKNSASPEFWPKQVADPIVTGVAAVSFLALLALLVTGRMSAAQRAMFFMVCSGLLINAAVFGGLSAPVDRYQARMMWLVPGLLVLVLAQLSSERAASRVTRQPQSSP